MIEIIKSHITKFRKFSLVGVLNTIIDFVVYAILHEWYGVYFLFAHVAAFFVALVNSYILNAFWTFRFLDKQNLAGQFGKFTLVSFIGLGLSSIVLYLSSFYMNVYFAKLIAVAASLAVNYTGSALFVFKRRQTENAEN